MTTTTNACGDLNILQQHHLRSWVQLCGCKNRDCSPFNYFGSDCHLFEVAVSEEFIQGSLMPIRVLRGTGGEWCQVGTVARPPGRQRFVLNYFEACTPYLPFFHSLGKNPFHLYETVGECNAPSSPGSGWSNYVQVYSNIRLEARRSTTRTSRASQAPIDNQILGTVDNILRYAPLRVRVSDPSQTYNTRVIAVAYDCGEKCPACSGGGCQMCAGCGMVTPSGCPEDRYYVLKVDEVACKIFVEYYMQDMGTVVSTHIMNCTSDCGGVDCPITPTDMIVHNGHLVVSFVGSAPEVGVYAAPILGGGMLGVFRRVTDAPVRSLLSHGEFLFMGGWYQGAAAGQIHMTRQSVCSKVFQPFKYADGIGFNDIDGCASQLLAGGDRGAIAASNNTGYSWHVVPSPTTDRILSVALNQRDYWVGTETGDLYMSCNNGASWSLVASVTKPAEVQLSGEIDGGAIRCLEFANNHAGYFSSGNELFGTYSRGDYWNKGCPRFEFAPNANGAWAPNMSYAALAVPSCSESSFSSSNNFVVAANSFGSGPVNSLVLTGEALIEGMLPAGF